MAIEGQPQVRYDTIEQFWPFYVGEHLQKATRWLHFVGTTNFLLWLGVALATRKGRFVGLAIVSAYGFAWFAHFFVEKNRPATFKYPVKSLISDFIMYGKMWRGQMEAELAKYPPN